MKYLNIFLAVLFFPFSNLQSQEISVLSNEYTSIQKLEIFAKGCNSSQVKQLIAKDTTFNINYGGITLTPVQLAIDAFIEANNNKSLRKCDECISTILAIMQDKRYDFKVQPLRQKTDLVHVISQEIKIKNEPPIKQRYEILLNGILSTLEKKPNFQITYSFPTNTFNLPETPLQAAGAFGDESLCILIKRYPYILKEIDQRSDTNKYTPLMFAARLNNIKATKKLLFFGADYLENFTGYNVNGIAVIGIAQSAGHITLSNLIKEYKDGKINFEGCERNFLMTPLTSQ
ncbi:hypothetical protein [Ascidiimonas sp. W6]|uniref:hypothetical protein n=1 Tax=Ascidiimonas meishanensis TaxID=3128903 RepID=UPI0030EBD3C8